MAFNPFDKRPGERLYPTDLQRLITNQVAEGYYVEYKSEPNKNEKIRHSIASFANTYGGWYFIGVRTDANHIASAVDGFRLDSWHDPLSRIRDIAKIHIDPTPVIFPQLVELGNGLGVLAVYIPDDQASPFLTTDGRIYRRNEASSDPIPETNRYALDQLIERGAKRRRRFSDFALDRRAFSEAEKNQGWLNIYISPHPFGTINKHDIFEASTIRWLLERSRSPGKILLRQDGKSWLTGNTPFSSGQPTVESLVLRQVALGGNPFNTLTVELDVYGRGKILLPLMHGRGEAVWRPEDIRSPRARSAVKSAILCDSDQSRLLHRCNMETLWLSIASLVSYYLDWLGTLGGITGYDVAIELKQVWRFVPFFDFDSWGEHVETFGLPVVANAEIRIPHSSADSLFYPCEQALPLWLHICLEISLAFGLPREIFSENLVATIFRASERGEEKKAGHVD
jgi:hypothetical protein